MKLHIQRIIYIFFYVLCVTGTVFSYSFNNNISLSDVNISVKNGYTHISIPGYRKTVRPGDPKLPKKVFYIAIPPNSHIISKQIYAETSEVLIDAEIKPSSDYRNSLKKGKIQRSSVYENDDLFPSKSLKIKEKNIFNGITLLKCVFFPVRYNPVQNKLEICKNLNIRIETKRYTPYRSTKRSAYQLRKKIKLYKQNIINFETCKQWYFKSLYGNSSTAASANTAIYKSNESSLVDRKSMDKLIASFKKSKEERSEIINEINKYYDGFGNYIIVTSDTIVQSGVLDDFIAFKETKGFSVIVAGIESDIYPYYSGDSAAKIKKYIAEREAANDLSNLLIIGSRDNIPSRQCYTFSDEMAWSDYYYADTDSDWNSSGNSKYAEFDTDENIDFSAELHVGRIPFDDISQIRVFLENSMAFEALDKEAKKQALLAGALSDEETDGAVLMQAMENEFLDAEGFDSVSMYEKEGVYASSAQCDIALTSSAFITEIEKDPFFVCWWAHGYSNGNGIVRWRADGDTPILLSQQNVSEMSSVNNAVVFACSCYNDNSTESIAKEMLKKKAVAVIATTSTSWYKVGWDNKDDGGSTTMVYYFYKNVIQEGMSIGKALDQAKFDGIQYSPDQYMQHNIVGFNLLGDPGIYY